MSYKHCRQSSLCSLFNTTLRAPMTSTIPSYRSNGDHSPLSGETMEIIRVKALKKVLVHTPAFIILIFYHIIVKAPNSG